MRWKNSPQQPRRLIVGIVTIALLFSFEKVNHTYDDGIVKEINSSTAGVLMTQMKMAERFMLQVITKLSTFQRQSHC